MKNCWRGRQRISCTTHTQQQLQQQREEHLRAMNSFQRQPMMIIGKREREREREGGWGRRGQTGIYKSLWCQTRECQHTKCVYVCERESICFQCAWVLITTSIWWKELIIIPNTEWVKGWRNRYSGKCGTSIKPKKGVEKKSLAGWRIEAGMKAEIEK